MIAGVGGGPADALLFQGLHQGRFAVAGGGLGLVAEGLHGPAGGAVPHRQGRQQHLLALQGGIGIVAALHVGPEESGEVDPLATGAEVGGAEAAPAPPPDPPLSMVRRASAIWLATVRFQISS